MFMICKRIQAISKVLISFDEICAVVGTITLQARTYAVDCTCIIHRRECFECINIE